MRCLLDASICVEMIRGRSPAVTGKLKRRAIGSVGISSITLAEFQYGVAKSSDPARNTIALAHVQLHHAGQGHDRVNRQQVEQTSGRHGDRAVGGLRPDRTGQPG